MPATPAEPAAPAGEGTEGSTTYYRGNSATLSVSVPAEAKVFVNDAATRSLGEQRRYVSRGLLPGRTYTYNVRVEFEKDGQVVSETKSVRLTAGGEANLSFEGSTTGDKDQVADTPAETKLTLNVPADAKVVLAGNATKMTGSTRTFITKKLTSGQKWSDYVVSVTIERDGRPVTEQRTITLTAGEPQELTFTFDTDKVASAAR